MTTYTKDPNATLDYVWNWTPWLEGDTITSHSVIAPAGITVDSTTTDGKAVTVWLSGGQIGGAYDVVCRITTALGRTDDRTNTYLIRST